MDRLTRRAAELPKILREGERKPEYHLLSGSAPGSVNVPLSEHKMVVCEEEEIYPCAHPV